MNAKRNYEHPTEVQVFARLANFGPDPVDADVNLSIATDFTNTPTFQISSSAQVHLLPERWGDKEREGAVRDLQIIAGQKPIVTKAKKSIAGFKLREGNSIGAKVTLRGDRMWEFLDRLISIAIPRIRDFRGLPTKFDGSGNYTFGVTEQLIFPEIDYDRVDVTRGMHITIVTTARSDAEGKALLDAFGFPFRREGQGQ